MTLTDRSRTIFVLLLSLVGTAALFLPFTVSTSPWKVVTLFWDGLLLLLAAPFFLSIPILAWQIRRLIVDRLTTGEFAAAYVLSTAAMLSTTLVLAMSTFNLVRNPTDFPFVARMALVVACWLVLIANVLLLMRNRRMELPRETTAEAFLLGSYLPNAILCLVMFYPQGFFSGWQIGAYMIAVVSVGYLISIVLALRAEQRFSAAIPTT